MEEVAPSKNEGGKKVAPAQVRENAALLWVVSALSLAFEMVPISPPPFSVVLLVLLGGAAFLPSSSGLVLLSPSALVGGASSYWVVLLVSHSFAWWWCSLPPSGGAAFRLPDVNLMPAHEEFNSMRQSHEATHVAEPKRTA